MITNQTSQAGRESVTGVHNTTRKFACVKLAIDVHAANFKVQRQIGDLPGQPVQTFKPKDFLEFARKQLQQAEVVWSCYEAGPTGFWLHRQLSALGIKNLVVVAGNLDAYGRRVNNDRTDTRALGQKLSRYVAGDTEALAAVWVPTQEQEARRALIRQRSQFGKLLRAMAAMGRSACLLQGYRLKGRWWRETSWRELLFELPAIVVSVLERFRPGMAELEKQIALLTREIKAAAPKQLPKGMGALTYEQMEGEVMEWNRFKNRKQPGSFIGLCGGVSASGSEHADLPITKHGHGILRAIVIEWAWRMVVYQPQCRAVQRWRKELLEPGAHVRRRKKAIVALGRELFVELWRWRTGRATSEQLGWQMSEPV